MAADISEVPNLVASHICPTPGCPAATGGGRCHRCRTQAEQRRGTTADRGYSGAHVTRFRSRVLLRDTTCRWPSGCDRPAAHADHWPMSRRELLEHGLDPQDPRHGRGLCHRHHSAHTARSQPGGWNQAEYRP
jgi:5-methylcytosine-specific restriction protein A